MSTPSAKTLLVAVCVLVICSNELSFAILPGGCVRTGGGEESRELLEFTVPGRETDGVLTEIWSPQTVPNAMAEDRFSISPAITDQGFRYPRPFSQPTFVVLVGEIAEFRIVVTSETGVLIDKFDFEDIETGVYIFTIASPIVPAENAVVTLVYNGGYIGRKMMTTTELSGLR